jgi:N-acyl-D-amino-acid deacylase
MTFEADKGAAFLPHPSVPICGNMARFSRAHSIGKWALAVAALTCLGAQAPGTATPDYGSTYDLLLSNAQVVDGLGGPAYEADILVRGDTIVFVGQADESRVRAGRTVAANGRVAAPGFIDTHAHSDILDPAVSFENFVAQGVTTIILGQDGGSPRTADGNRIPLRTWLAAVEKREPELNVAVLSGHGTLRQTAGATSDALPTPQQFARMKEMLREDLAAGALGLSTGLEYVPGRYSSREELIELAKVVGKVDGVVVSHLRTEDSGQIGGAIDELLEQGRHARVHLSHVKIVLGKRAEEATAVLKQLEEARSRGISVTGDVYPYLAGYNDLGLVYPPWAKAKNQFELAARERRHELESYLLARVNLRNGPGAILLASAPYSGMTLEQVAQQKRKPFQKIIVDLGYGGPKAAHFVMSQPVQDVFILDENIAIATDGGPTIAHPRSFGTFAKVLEEYVVRDRRMSLEAAVRKMTALPAQAMGLRDRGVLRAGAKADIVLFDPRKIAAKATWEKPALFAQGFDLVLINGRPAREEGRMNRNTSGRVLLRADAANPAVVKTGVSR